MFIKTTSTHCRTEKKTQETLHCVASDTTKRSNSCIVKFGEKLKILYDTVLVSCYYYSSKPVMYFISGLRDLLITMYKALLFD